MIEVAYIKEQEKVKSLSKEVQQTIKGILCLMIETKVSIYFKF